jgi:hypothetical protein
MLELQVSELMTELPTLSSVLSQGSIQSANPLTREVTTAQWRGNEDYASDFRAVPKDTRTDN